MESLDALRQAVNDLILSIETLFHLVLKAFSETHEFGHSLFLELFDVLVLLLQLLCCVVLECSELQRLVRSLIVNLLLQVVLAVDHLLHYVLLALDSRLNLAIELVLQVYKRKR